MHSIRIAIVAVALIMSGVGSARSDVRASTAPITDIAPDASETAHIEHPEAIELGGGCYWNCWQRYLQCMNNGGDEESCTALQDACLETC